jgi:hypothetical protein
MTDRGGWNTDGPRQSGRRARSEASTKEEAAGAITRGGRRQQARELPRSLKVPAAGAAAPGSPVHHVPLQGRRDGALGSGADWSAWWSMRPLKRDGARARSAWDVTELEQPPQTRGGTASAAARSVIKIAAVGQNERRVIRYSSR